MDEAKPACYWFNPGLNVWVVSYGSVFGLVVGFGLLR
jgi:pyoverdine/dityrosine biosynthesis protein Dit1